MKFLLTDVLPTYLLHLSYSQTFTVQHSQRRFVTTREQNSQNKLTLMHVKNATQTVAGILSPPNSTWIIPDAKYVALFN